MQKVFTAAEQQCILSSSAIAPNTLLWLLWAAKEAAFKIIAKIIQQPAFIHTKFQTSAIEINNQQGQMIVQYEQYAMHIYTVITHNYIHAYGALGDFTTLDALEPVDALDAFNVLDSFDKYADAKLTTNNNLDILTQLNVSARQITTEEQNAANSTPSTIIRMALKNSLAHSLHQQPDELQIVRASANNRMQPPYLLINGAPSTVNLSLSHHGDWIAWAFSI